MTIMSIILIAVVSVVVYFLIRSQSQFPVLQYIFFNRFTLLLAILMLALPPLSVTILSPVLLNLFVLEHGWEITLITSVSIFLAWVNMYTFFLMLRSIPERFDLDPIDLPTWLRKYRLIIFGLLVVPTAITLLLFSNDISLLFRMIGVFIGIAVAGLFWFLSILAKKIRTTRKTPKPVKQPRLFEGMPVQISLGYSDVDKQEYRHASALWLLTLTLVFYIIGFFLLKPSNSWVPPVQIPALTYLLLLFILAGWALPALSFFLDKFRVPTLITIMAASAFLYSIVSDTDHFYEVQERSETQRELLNPATALEQWHKTHPRDEYPVMVLVTAKGGGISAALWTAQVLTALQDSLGKKFAESIILISCASGGSVGAMYYVDAFENGPPAKNDFARIVAAAGGASLSPTLWGIIYPDLWRIFAAPLQLMDKSIDRGWALEVTWEKSLLNPQPTMNSWRQGIAEGWRPSVIFNSTLVETGERFLLTPLDLDTDKWRSKSFFALYPEYDSRISTAARLSATFPYISPIPRPAFGDQKVDLDYHLADGGYYDNYGILSAIDWIRATVAKARELNRRKIVIVQIRESAGDTPKPKDGAGWFYAAAGPLVTILNVRETQQLQLGEMEIDLLRKAYTDFEIETVSFNLVGAQPLSWQLSQKQKDRIKSQWFNASNREELKKLKGLF